MRKIMEISEDVDTGHSNIPVETSGLITFLGHSVQHHL